MLLLLNWLQGEWNLPASAGGGRRQSWWSRQPTAVKAAVITAVGVVIAALVGGLPAALLSSHSSPAPQPSPPSLSAAGSPKPSHPQVTTAPATPQPKILAQDNFCSKEDGWNNAAVYSNCALLIRTKPNQPHGDIESSEPTGSNSLYPQAPSSITVEVVAQMIVGSTQGDPQFGVSCRAGPNLNDPSGYGYSFIVSQDQVQLIKYSNNTGQVGPALADEPVTLDLTHSNTLMAACDRLNGGTAVRLALWMNGQHLLDVTENSPVANGTVGLFAATAGNIPISNVMQFKSFKVTQL
jgi:hypothetical protein